MKSIRTKVALLTICIIIATMTITTVLGTIAIRSIGKKDSEQMLLLLCQTGQKNLDVYFRSVEQSVETLASFVKHDMDGLENLDAHVERTRAMFAETVKHTHGVLTYYYRIDPEVSDVKGFWYTNLDGSQFEEHEVTDITLYDTSDSTHLVWFTVPKLTGEAMWLPPYVTDNLDVRVMSYNVPVYWKDTFVGVIGIEIEAETMQGIVNSLQIFNDGYAFINDDTGYLIYHSRLSDEEVNFERRRGAPYGMTEQNTVIQYTYNGTEKKAVWLPLRNGMRINVAVPLSEIDAGWRDWIYETTGSSVILLVIFIALTMHLTGRITSPLRELSKAAEQVDQGNYDVNITYDADDEIGNLSRTFSSLVDHLRTYIRSLKDMAYGDALTAVRNKGAFDIVMKQTQEQMEQLGDQAPGFAVCIFDCNDLKMINDHYGHDKGDLYLKRSCKTICQVFAHCPVFRIGGDEFAALLLNNAYENRDELIATFDRRCFDLRAMATVPWENIDIARGMAVYIPGEKVENVIHRADQLMYEDKRKRKKGR